MKETPRRTFTYSNVISTLCLFLILGGSAAFAATQLPRNSVGSEQLKNGSITLAELSARAKKALKGARGPQGPQGVSGVTGAPGATKVVVRSGSFQEGRSIASCQPGEVATGGGGWVHPEEPKAWIWTTLPVQNNGEVPTAWEAQAANVEDFQASVQAYVICAAP